MAGRAPVRRLTGGLVAENRSRARIAETLSKEYAFDVSDDINRETIAGLAPRARHYRRQRFPRITSVACYYVLESFQRIGDRIA